MPYDPVKRKEYREQNKEKIQAYGKEYRQRTKLERREYRQSNKDKINDVILKFKYGISLEKHNSMLALQNGVCKICHQPEIRKLHGKITKISVDHDHLTGRVRGLLCSRCNLIIGKCKDDPILLRKAAEYLENHILEEKDLTKLEESSTMDIVK